MKNYTIRKIITSVVQTQQNNVTTAWAELLSNTFKAQLMLYNAIGTAGPDGALNEEVQGIRVNKLFKTAMIRLRTLGNSLQGAYSIKYFVESGRHWHNLVSHIQEEHTDLLVAEMPQAGETTPGPLVALMYNSPCPMLFVREGMQPAVTGKILVPVRLKDGLEQKLPVVIAWAKAHNAIVCLSAFAGAGATAKQKTALYFLVEKMADALRDAGVKLEIETAHGFHFGTAMAERAKQLQADMIAIAIEPTNFISRLFTKMIGPYFLEHSPVPVLAVPILKTVSAAQTVEPREHASPLQVAVAG